MVDWHYIRTQLQRNPQYSDKSLYKIAIHAELLTYQDILQMQGYQLTPELRSRVLGWLRHHANQIGATITP
jgi:hypothetical protein